jgi:ABC-type molybdate transport system substrate-binding protein
LAPPIRATAPYGAAAIETMKALGMYEKLITKIVQANDIALTFEFVDTGAAELGFVALSEEWWGAVDRPNKSLYSYSAGC